MHGAGIGVEAHHSRSTSRWALKAGKGLDVGDQRWATSGLAAAGPAAWAGKWPLQPVNGVVVGGSGDGCPAPHLGDAAKIILP